MGGENWVKSERVQWRERAPAPLELGPLVVNWSWQHLILTLSPKRRCAPPLIPLRAREPWQDPQSPDTHLHARLNRPLLAHSLLPPPASFPCLGPGLSIQEPGANIGPCGTGGPLMWADRADNYNQHMLYVSGVGRGGWGGGGGDPRPAPAWRSELIPSLTHERAASS